MWKCTKVKARHQLEHAMMIIAYTSLSMFALDTVWGK